LLGQWTKEPKRRCVVATLAGRILERPGDDRNRT
jgi:hypothetical protein